MKLRKSSSCLITRICRLLLIAAIPIVPLSVHAQNVDMEEMRLLARDLRIFVEKNDTSSVADGTSPPPTNIQIEEKFRSFCVDNQEMKILEILRRVSVAAREIDRRSLLNETEQVISDGSLFEEFLGEEALILEEAGFAPNHINIILNRLRENRDDVERIIGNLDNFAIYEVHEMWGSVIDRACNSPSSIDSEIMQEIMESGKELLEGALTVAVDIPIARVNRRIAYTSASLGLISMYEEGLNLIEIAKSFFE